MIERRCQRIADEFCTTHNLPSIPVKFTKALKTANGTYHHWYNNTYRKAKTPQEISEGITRSVIKISSYILPIYSEEEVIQTLIHELAHHYCVMNRKDISHSEYFKRKCVEFGGSMNQEMAGHQYSSNATDNFVSKKIGFTLECQCGKPNHGEMSYVNSPRESSLVKFCCPACKTIMKHWKRIEK